MIFTNSAQVLLSTIKQKVDAVAVSNWPWIGQLVVQTPTPVNTSCRLDTTQLKAAKLFQQAISTGMVDVSQPGIEAIFLADLYRRAGDFEMADQVLRQNQHSALEDSLVKVLEYEQDLIQAQDRGYYQIAEALEL